MSDTPGDYDTRLNVLCGPLERIDVPALATTVTHPWFNQTLCRVNGSVVRVGIVKGEYHWHHHEADDEFFHVLEGRLFLDYEAGAGRVPTTVTLAPGQGFVVPKGVRHRTRAPERTIMLMVENAGIVPTGDPG